MVKWWYAVSSDGTSPWKWCVFAAYLQLDTIQMMHHPGWRSPRSLKHSGANLLVWNWKSGSDFWKYQDQDPTTHPKINTEGALQKRDRFFQVFQAAIFLEQTNVNVQGSNKQKWGVESSGLGNQTRTDELQVVGLPKNEVNKNGNCKYRHHSLCDLFFNFHDSQLHCVWAGYNVSLFIVFEVKAQYIQYVAFCFLFIYLLCFNKQFEGTSIGSLLVKGNPKK